MTKTLVSFEELKKQAPHLTGTSQKTHSLKWGTEEGTGNNTIFEIECRGGSPEALGNLDRLISEAHPKASMTLL